MALRPMMPPPRPLDRYAVMLMAMLCAVAATCDDQASTAYFQSNLAGFSPYPLPTPQTMPTQETGSAAKPSGAC